MSNQAHVPATLGHPCSNNAAATETFTAMVGAACGGRIADSYFFSELCTHYGEQQAINFLIARREQRQHAPFTRSASTSSMGSASSRSPQASCTSTSSSMWSSSSYTYLKSARPCQLSSGSIHHGSTSAASDKASTTCRCSSETHGRESFERMRHSLGASAGLLYTDAAHLVMDEADALSSDSQ